MTRKPEGLLTVALVRNMIRAAVAIEVKRRDRWIAQLQERIAHLERQIQVDPQEPIN